MNLKHIMENSFYQLLLLYSTVIFIISLGFFSRYALQFNILAIIIAVIGAFTLKKERQKSSHYLIIILAAILILTIRTIPYINNEIPLGYDPGMYKYAIETPLSETENWVFTTHEPFFLYLFQWLHRFLSAKIILIHLFIIITLLLGVSIYFFTKAYFDRETAAISIFLYSISVIQFKVFWFMYYRNIIGLALFLLAFTLLRKKKNISFAITAALTGAFHRPTFYLLGLTYLFYAVISPYKKQKYDRKQLLHNIITGSIIILLFLLTHLGRFMQAIVTLTNPVLNSFVETGTASGTFINFFTYQYNILPYIALALLGLFYSIKNRQYNILLFWTVINAAIVIFQFFFFNRFIIPLDIAILVYAAYGTTLLLSQNRWFSTIAIILLFVAAILLIFQASVAAKPLITETELNSITYLQTTEPEAYVMATSSIYSPWVQGYSGRKTIAPGLFDYDTHNRAEWEVFWTTTNLTEAKEFLNVYETPLYLHIGQQQQDNIKQFPECFRKIYDNKANKIYKYGCGESTP